MRKTKKKNTGSGPSNPAQADDGNSTSSVGDLSSVASKMNFIDAALGVLNEPTRKLPPIGKSNSIDLASDTNNMKFNEPAEGAPASTSPLPALSEKTAAALSRFQAALGKAPKIESKFGTKSSSKTTEGEKRKTRAEPRKLKRAHELKPEVSLKDIAAELPASTKLPERTLQDLTAEFESSFSTELDYDLSIGPDDAVELEEITLKTDTVPAVVAESIAKVKKTKPGADIVTKEPAETKPTYVAKVSAPDVKTRAKLKPAHNETVISKLSDLVSTIGSPAQKVAGREPVDNTASSMDLADDPSPKTLQNAVHELELGDLHDKQPDFTYLRHTIRKLHYRYMASNDIDAESREDFETVLKTLSLASVQYRMMKEKHDDYNVVARERDKETEKLISAHSSIKDRERSLEKLKLTISGLEQDAVESTDRFNSELEDMKSSLVAERGSLKFDLERVKTQERKVMQRLEETSERLLESETRLEDSTQSMTIMRDKVAFAQAEAEVLRNSLDEACEKIVLIASANMQTEMRIQELEDEIAELQTR